MCGAGSRLGPRVCWRPCDAVSCLYCDGDLSQHRLCLRGERCRHIDRQKYRDVVATDDVQSRILMRREAVEQVEEKLLRWDHGLRALHTCVESVLLRANDVKETLQSMLREERDMQTQYVCTRMHKRESNTRTRTYKCKHTCAYTCTYTYTFKDTLFGWLQTT